MFEKLFSEIFGGVDWEKFETSPFEEKAEKENENENSSYFHKVEEKYENGKCVSHIEKEVKDGKVLKDINYCPSIEDKTKNDDTCHENKLEETEKALKDANEKIKTQQEVINDYKKYCAELEEKLKKINKLIN